MKCYTINKDQECMYRVPINVSENLKMKNENFSYFHLSFLLKIENDFSNPSFKSICS